MPRVRCIWWNVHNLFPFVPGKTGRRFPPSSDEYERKLRAVADVIRAAPGGIPELVMICEVAYPKFVDDQDALADLACVLGGSREHYTGVSGDSTGITCGAIWDTGALALSGKPICHDVVPETRPSAVGRPILELNFHSLRRGRQFTAYLNHWTSRATDRNGGKRRVAGRALVAMVQRLVMKQRDGKGHDPNALVVAAGDFNYEPFDDSLRDPEQLEAIAISRDRTPVLQRGERATYPVLCNPSWRLLGEMQSISAQLASGTEAPAGTFLYGDDVQEGHWSTFDQVLVSAGMLAGPQPVFDEESLVIHHPAGTVGADGEPALASDHFPIFFGLDF